MLTYDVLVLRSGILISRCLQVKARESLCYVSDVERDGDSDVTTKMKPGSRASTSTWGTVGLSGTQVLNKGRALCVTSVDLEYNATIL